MRILFVAICIYCTVLLATTYAAPQYSYDNHFPMTPTNNDGSDFSELIPPTMQPNRHHGGEKYLPPAPTTAAPIIRKQFYLISAPEDGENQQRTRHLVLGRPQKNYRVIFIKAPGENGGNIKYSAELAPQEEKTVIYVLSKKSDDLDGNNIIATPTTQPSKPEVFFIKYKTDDEAQQAQKEIQDEYDKLGGTNEFVQDKAPITSVVGSLDGLNPDGSYNYHQINTLPEQQQQQQPQQPSNQYLPSLVFNH